MTAVARASDEATATVVVQEQSEPVREEAHLHLRLEDPERTGRQVTWTTDTVDNEGMGKKKSKCCCVYHKKKKWDESDSDESDEEGETPHCHGHCEKRQPAPEPAAKND